jgi:two-component system, cell cycle sensor histidine kinase and response regulator CckA
MCEQSLESTTQGAWDHDVIGATLGCRETILFVEDEDFVRNVTGEVLCSAGYRVLAVRNAFEALAVYDQHHGEIDLLLTDVVLPGENGRGLARKLRLRNPALAVLLVTGYVEQMATHEAEPAECLAKPFSTGILLQKIRELLDDRRGVFEKQFPEENPIRRVSGNA